MSSMSAPAISEPKLPHLLVVDDDAEITTLIQRYFCAQQFRVSAVHDGAGMRQALASDPVDLVLLDLGLPGEDGFALTRHLREHWHGPVIIVSGRGDAVDRVVGLELGADDYVTKPFELRELLARVRSVLRRAAPTAPAASTGSAGRVLAFAGFRLDPGARTLLDPERTPVALTTGEFELLSVLLAEPNRVLSRDDLMTRIHGHVAGPFDRAIDVQIGRLRRKIEHDPANPELIKSVRGAGYVFAAKVETAPS
jgi:two-component system OmpR family response regulator